MPPGMPGAGAANPLPPLRARGNPPLSKVPELPAPYLRRAAAAHGDGAVNRRAKPPSLPPPPGLQPNDNAKPGVGFPGIPPLPGAERPALVPQPGPNVKPNAEPVKTDVPPLPLVPVVPASQAKEIEPRSSGTPPLPEINLPDLPIVDVGASDRPMPPPAMPPAK